MKKAIIYGLSIMLAGGFFTGCGSTNTTTADGLSKELNVYNWSEYLPQEVIHKFEETYGVKVNYSTYSSNEEMLAKIMAGGSQYDIAVASDYMVDIMKKQNLIEYINFENIPNYKNIGDGFKNLAFDPQNEYTVPYMCGSALIAVNTDKVQKEIKSYEDLWDPSLKNSLVVLDDQRAIIGIALKKLGYSFNEIDENILNQAKQELATLLPNIKSFDSDSPKTLLINGEAAVGYVWNAEASLAIRENPNIQVVIPPEGLYLWQDNFVIPKGAKNQKTAEVFINFILEPEMSKIISEEHPYTNPNVEAQKLLDESILNDIATYPPDEVQKKGEYLIDLGETTVLYDRIWTEFKQQ